MKHEFRHEDNRICCSSNNVADLCAVCRVIASASAALRRAQAATGRVLRVGITACTCNQPTHDHSTKEFPMAIPDAYAPGLAALRAACPHVARQLAAHADDDAKLADMAKNRQAVLDMALTSRRAAFVPATSPAHLSPPDPYAMALAEKKEEGR